MRMYFDSMALKFISKLTLILAVLVMLLAGLKAYQSIQASPEMQELRNLMQNQQKP